MRKVMEKKIVFLVLMKRCVLSWMEQCARSMKTKNTTNAGGVQKLFTTTKHYRLPLTRRLACM